ncbi:response regulator transcription factor [Micromonospora sp. WMMD1128]|uniref:LuxR C-terminal-related transcriptional regulator n=1 Tax=Micromonospora sp. WMMD1128 TaxID=3015150 RepID=UPI00248BC95D|nr:response regulator transcription factor [Micromonospora sp. WMMD1128]WBB76688.1 response regulator transcription factor [Micromonospora sp. WMMD1128]
MNDTEPASTVRVAVVGEPGLCRTLVAGVVASAPDFEVVRECDGNATDLCRLAAAHPDLVLVDLSPEHEDPEREDPEHEPWAVVAALRGAVPDCAVVVLTGRPTARVLRSALRLRARGVVAKDVPPEEMLARLRAVADGHRTIDPVTALAALDTADNPLSDREREVAAVAAKGLPSREIAALLHLAPGTVRNHLSSLLRKAGGRNRWEAVQRARDAGWI